MQLAHRPSKLGRPKPRATVRPVQLALSIGLRDRIEQLALEKGMHHRDRKQEVAWLQAIHEAQRKHSVRIPGVPE